jgi:hypothetical protein
MLYLTTFSLIKEVPYSNCPYPFTAKSDLAKAAKNALLFMRCMTSNGICRGFAFKYGKFPLPLRYRTALSVPKVPTHVQ